MNGILRSRVTSEVLMGLVLVIGAVAFFWPFLITAQAGVDHGSDASWIFTIVTALMALLLLAELGAGGLDAKGVAVLGVLCAVGAALDVLGAGTAGLNPMFFLLVIAGRVLGRSTGFAVGALSMTVGGFLTGGIGPWVPFQVLAGGFVAYGAALLPQRLRGRAEVLVVAVYGFLACLAYGVVMNLYFWPFMATAMAPQGAGFIPGAPVAENLRYYLNFYVLTSVGWDLGRAVLCLLLTLLVGRPVLGILRRAVRRAAFDARVELTAPRPGQEES